jgi:hypothetical protein
MSGFISFAASAGSPSYPNRTFETLGVDTAGQGTTLTGGTANGLGSYASIGTTAAAWAGFWVTLANASNSGNRHLFDISFDNGSTTKVSQYYFVSQSLAAPSTIFIPMDVAAGSQMSGRIRCSAGSSPTIRMALRGLVRTAADPTLFTTMTQLHGPDTANTRASATNILSASPGTYTEVVAATAAQYSAFSLNLGDSGTTATGGAVNARIGVDAAGGTSYVEWASFGTRTTSSSPFVAHANSPVFQKIIGSGAKVAVALDGGGGDNYRAQLIGWS